MIEAYDAASNSEVIQSYSILLAWIGLGLLLEFIALPLLQRYVAARRWFPAEVLFGALSGQLLFWLSFTGLITTLAVVVPNVRLTGLVRSSLLFLAALAITLFLVRLVTNAIRLYFLRREIGSISLLDNILRFLGGTVIIATALTLLGVPIGPLLTVLAGSSIGLSLALRDPLANLFSGMTVLASNKIQLGDYIRLSTGQEGYVIDIRWSDTYIQELANNLIIIPNALMTNTILTNFYRPEPEFSLLFDMGVSYDSDLAQIERLVIAVGEEVHAQVPGGIATVPPLVRFNVFGETSVRFTVILRVRTFVDQFLVQHEFMKRLQARFAAEGLPPPTPVQVLRVEASEAQPEQSEQQARTNGEGEPPKL